jgi:hypothetical protein
MSKRSRVLAGVMAMTPIRGGCSPAILRPVRPCGRPGGGDQQQPVEANTERTTRWHQADHEALDLPAIGALTEMNGLLDFVGLRR